VASFQRGGFARFVVPVSRARAWARKSPMTTRRRPLESLGVASTRDPGADLMIASSRRVNRAPRKPPTLRCSAPAAAEFAPRSAGRAEEGREVGAFTVAGLRRHPRRDALPALSPFPASPALCASLSQHWRIGHRLRLGPRPLDGDLSCVRARDMDCGTLITAWGRQCGCAAAAGLLR
jgi:hypothetical protein